MAVKLRADAWYAYIRPFKGKQVGVKLDVKNKTEAKQVEVMIVRACKTGNYGILDSTVKDACVRMFHNQGWQLPEELSGCSPTMPAPPEELTFWKACELFSRYPGISGSQSLWRHEIALVNLTCSFGKEFPVNKLWVPQIREYQAKRLSSGKSAETVNRELSTLSKLFGVLIELRLVDTNPVRLVKRLSTKAGERQVYLNWNDVHLIMSKCPAWYQSIVTTAFYTGMRRGEILSLTHKQLNLSKRIITLAPDDTKEANWKRVPIHRDLVPYLEETLKFRSIASDRVFLVHGRSGIRSPGKDTIKNPWARACEALKEEKLLQKPFPRFHDLRHTWKTNARRSGMDPEIRESILGHSTKHRSVSERYGYISDQELVKAIDGMTLDHGETKILVAR